MAKFRYHRGSFEESMKTRVDVFSKQDIADKMNRDEVLCEEGRIFTVEDITVTPYCYDGRLDEQTFLVIVDNYPVGMTDEMLF